MRLRRKVAVTRRRSEQRACDTPPPPGPLHLGLPQGELAARAARAREILRACCLCPRDCGVDRLDAGTAAGAGRCRTREGAVVTGYGPHFGEESVLVGRGGSGTIFFGGCNLNCVFCQNYETSQLREGREVTSEQLSRMMLALQARGCENINFVSPSHVVPAVLAALDIAVSGGLTLPLVYNTGGYDALTTLKLLDGVIDIYMPDMKYARAEIGLRLSGVRDYPKVNRAAVKEMHRQVGDLKVDAADGVARRGLLVRHLVLPGGLAGTADTMRWLAKEISPATAVNVMNQYYPCYKADEHPPLDRRVTAGEWAAAVKAVRAAGLVPLREMG
jgi:putative pyruvate formate lyase activating enzyme